MNLPANLVVTLRLDGSPGNLDADLYLYNAGGFEVERSTRPGDSQEQITYTPPFGGRYYIRVHPVSGWNTALYTLEVSWRTEFMQYIPLLARMPTPTFTPTPTPDPCDAYGPNNSWTAAYGPLIGGQIYRDALCGNDYSDWFFVDLTQVGSLTIDLTSIPAGANYDLWLYGNPPGDYSLRRSTNPGNTDEYIEYLAPAAGCYFIRITRAAGAYGSTGHYSLRMSMSTPTPTPGPCQRYEPNDTLATAFGPLANGAVIEAALCEGDSDDWYKVTLDTAAALEATLDNLPAGTDYDLYLYSAAGGASLALSANTGVTPEVIRVNLPAGRYGLRVYPFSGRSPQPYRLSVRW